MADKIDFPEKASDVRQASVFYIKEIYTAFNPGWGKDGANGLWIVGQPADVQSKTILNRERTMFFPERGMRTQALLEGLNDLKLQPADIGGWKELEGYVIRFEQEERTIRIRDRETGQEREIRVNQERPVEVMATPEASKAWSGTGGVPEEPAADEAEPPSETEYDELRNKVKELAIGKDAKELLYAANKTPEIMANKSFATSLRRGKVIEELEESGELVKGDDGKFEKGIAY